MSLNFSSLNFNKESIEQKVDSSSALSLAFCDNEDFALSKKNYLIVRVMKAQNNQ